MRYLGLILLSIITTTTSLSLRTDNPGVEFLPSKYVIVVGCDGMGQMYIENATHFLPNFSYLIRNGATHNRTRTRMPSVSAPNWATIITGMEPEKSGVYNNDWVPSWSRPPNTTVFEMPPASGVGNIPTPIWSIIKRQSNNRYKTAVFHSWSWIKNLINDDVDFSIDGNENDTLIMETALNHIRDNMSNFMFLHLDEVDDAGHGSYWGSPRYYNAIKNIDNFLGRLVETLRVNNYLEETTIFVTADHGGWRSSHGFFNEVSMYVPNILYGYNIRSGYNSNKYTTNIDYVPTLLHLLGLKPTEYTSGRIMYEMFRRF